MLRPPRDLTKADFHAKVSDQELLTVIRVGKGQMPAFGGLMAEDDLRAVISYIRTLAPHAPGAPPASPGGAPAASPGGAPASGAAKTLGIVR